MAMKFKGHKMMLERGYTLKTFDGVDVYRKISSDGDLIEVAINTRTGVWIPMANTEKNWITVETTKAVIQILKDYDLF